MSLVVSLRVPDGIVVAADSLSTSRTLLEIIAKTENPEGGQQVRLPSIPIPFSASSFTQKLFSLYGQFALSSFGEGIINGRTVYYHAKQFEKQERGKPPPECLEEVAERFVAYMERELLAQHPKYPEEAPDDWKPVGFHLNGFKESEGRSVGVTYEIYVGKHNLSRERDDIGCTIGGATNVVKKFWEIGTEDPRQAFKYHLFSLQDAIDLCDFLIDSTGKFQRFANELSTVGGEIDIALLTPFHGFQWIKQKSLMSSLEAGRIEEKEEEDSE